MKKVLLFCALMMFCLFITACGSSSSGSGNGGGEGDGGAPQGSSGKVIADLASYNAVVCYDRNGNKSCDANEPDAQVSGSGGYTISSATANDIANIPLLAEFRPKTATTALSGASFIMEAPKGKTLVSSFTTMVKNLMDTDATYTQKMAEDKIAINLGRAAGTDFYSESLYNDPETKKVNNAAAEVMAQLTKDAQQNGIQISPELATLISNLITDLLSKVVQLVQDGSAAGSIAGQISQDTKITQEDVDKTADQMSDAKNSGDIKFEDVGDMYEIRIEDIWQSNNNRQYWDNLRLINMPLINSCFTEKNLTGITRTEQTRYL